MEPERSIDQVLKNASGFPDNPRETLLPAGLQNVLKLVRAKKREERDASGRGKYAWRTGYLLKLMRYGAFSYPGTASFRAEILDTLLPKDMAGAVGRLATAILETAGTDSGLRALSNMAADLRSLTRSSQCRELLIRNVASESIEGDQAPAMAAVIAKFQRVFPEFADAFLEHRKDHSPRLCIFTQAVWVIGDDLPAKSPFREPFENLCNGYRFFLKRTSGDLPGPRSLITEDSSIEEIEALMEDKWHYGRDSIPKDTARIRSLVSRGKETYETLRAQILERHDSLFAVIPQDTRPEISKFYETARRLYGTLAMRTAPAFEVYGGYESLRAEDARDIFDREFPAPGKTPKGPKLRFTVYSRVFKDKTVARGTKTFMEAVDKALTEEFGTVVWPQLPCSRGNVVVYLPRIRKFLRLIKRDGGPLARLKVLSEFQSLPEGFYEIRGFREIQIGPMKHKFREIFMDDILRTSEPETAKMRIGDYETRIFAEEKRDYSVVSAKDIFDAVSAAIFAGCGDLANRNFEYSRVLGRYIFIDVDKGAQYTGSQLADKIEEAADRAASGSTLIRRLKDDLIVLSRPFTKS